MTTSGLPIVCGGWLGVHMHGRAVHAGKQVGAEWCR